MDRITSLLAISLLVLYSSCAQKKDYVITIKTDMGDMVAILYDETPKHKENFLKLVKDHFYDSLVFHRVIQGFMIQGGDPDSKHAQSGQRLGSGGPGYTVEAEIRPQFFHGKGALSAARLGDGQNPTKASSGSQFYIVQGTVIPPGNMEELKIDQAKLNAGLKQLLEKEENKPLYDSLSQLYYTGDMEAYKNKLFSLIPRIEKETGLQVKREVSEEKIKVYTTLGGSPHLDNEYTVFGQVIQGLEVIDKIAAVERDGADRPLKDVRFSVFAEELPRKKITKLYGYSFPEKKQ